MMGILVKVLHNRRGVWQVHRVRFDRLVGVATLDFVFSLDLFFGLRTRQGRIYFAPLGGTSRPGVLS